jgi:endonuclease G
MSDYSSILPVSEPLAHALDLFCFHGHPENQNEKHPVSIIVSHGFAVGFSPSRLQPIWAAYRVSAAKRDVNYERPHLFYDDPRIPAEWRITNWTFGKSGSTAYDRGHMVPNFAVNTQFGRLAQMETFFMTNICPQKKQTNQGVWMRLEKIIVSQWAPEWDHIWVITGPIFSSKPKTLKRSNGLKVPVPKGFFAILADPLRWPYDNPKNVRFLALNIPQSAGYDYPNNKYVTTVAAIEEATKLKFFPYLSSPKKKTVAKQTSKNVWDYSEL